MATRAAGDRQMDVKYTFELWTTFNYIQPLKVTNHGAIWKDNQIIKITIIISNLF